MAQDLTLNLPNIDRGAAARSKLNSIFEALTTANSGGTAPSATYPFMFWADSDTDYLKIRNEANSGWNIIGKLGSEGLVLTSAGDPNGAVTGAYEGQILFDTTNNIPWYYSGSGTSWFTSNGTASLVLPDNIVTKTANYTATTADSIILCDATSGNITITLYTAIGNAGRKLTIIKTDSSANTVTIDGNGSETINGALTQVLRLQNAILTLISDGLNWRIENLPGRVLLNETVISSPVASVDFTSLINSAYRRYSLEVINVVPATDDTYLLLRASTDNGSTFRTATADYSCTGAAYWHNPGVNQGGASTAALGIWAVMGGVGATTGISSVAAEGGVSGVFEIFDPLSSVANKHCTVLASWALASDNFFGSQSGGGTFRSITAVNAVRLLFSSGNIASGRIRLYGVN